MKELFNTTKKITEVQNPQRHLTDPPPQTVNYCKHLQNLGLSKCRLLLQAKHKSSLKSLWYNNWHNKLTRAASLPIACSTEHFKSVSLNNLVLVAKRQIKYIHQKFSVPLS